ncbi:MAG: septal ring lytic transglycosylase RlpA family protein [Acidobacteria bacterium]|nr:septal ring lytic transglycosylase RlpA family protein [Acidobacteriota bacterium]
MRKVLAQALATFLTVATLAAAPIKHPTAEKSSAKHKAYQVGKASWYGKAFDGRATASGERYEMFRFTAAHRTLPLGTVVRVTSLRTGKWVVVKINDRGPVVEGRIIDLSYGAAQMLGLRAHGVETVRLDLLPPQEPVVAENFNRGFLTGPEN